MSLVYRSQVTRCWEVTDTNHPHQHFFAFELKSKSDAVLIYGIISASPAQGVTVESNAVEIDDNASQATRRPLPRSIGRLILTGKPLVESVLRLQAKRSQLQTQWDQSLAKVAAGQAGLDKSLQLELWAIDDYLDRLYTTLSQLYRQVALETELIQFDATTTDEDLIEEAESRAEHVEQLLDSFENRKRDEKRKPWFVPKMLHRYR
ncbi:MAG: hypothetical protein ACFCU8_08235 [Thermosynechococcaceae cyanobacterium]